MLKRVLFLLALAAALTGATQETAKVTAFNAVGAASDRTSDWIDASKAHSGSFHCVWASLTGTPDGAVQVQISNDGGATAVDKTGATFTVSGASGSNAISLNGVVTESLYRIKWAHNNVSGGTVSCFASMRG